MQENFLHYLWEFQKWGSQKVATTEDIPLEILSPGKHNFSSGPDFFNARIVVGHQEWAGNVEIHINSSDWYLHGHETDTNYDNVILHVVWNHNTEIYRKDESPVPVLELRNLVSPGVLENYKQLFENSTKKWINCEQDFPVYESFDLQNWLERLYFERLEQKSERVSGMLKDSKNNWEEVLFKMLAKNFGLNVNGEAFLSLANAIPFSVVRKISRDKQQLEALFLGKAGLLQKDLEDGYYKTLKQEFSFVARKFEITNSPEAPVKFFRLRPDNFPNIRLAQLAALYHKNQNLFSEVIQAKTRKEYQEIFKVGDFGYWETYYNFQKPHKKRKKQLSQNFIDLLLINTVIPIKFCYYREIGKNKNEELTQLMGSLSQEKNQTVQKYNSLRPGTAVNAMQSQALLQLKNEYCDKNKCLQCNLGIKFLQRKNNI